MDERSEKIDLPEIIDRMKTKDLLLVIVQFILLIVFIAIPAGPAESLYYQVPAFLLTISGIIIFATAILQLGGALTPLPTPKTGASLITNGIYKYARHPVYTGILLATAGISLYTLSLPRFIITLILFFFFNYKSRYEETMLRIRYTGYEFYASKTSRFFPKIF